MQNIVYQLYTPSIKAAGILAIQKSQPSDPRDLKPTADAIIFIHRNDIKKYNNIKNNKGVKEKKKLIT